MQFINGILDAIKRDLDEQQPQEHVQPEEVEPPQDDETEETLNDELDEAPGDSQSEGAS